MSFDFARGIFCDLCGASGPAVWREGDVPDESAVRRQANEIGWKTGSRSDRCQACRTQDHIDVPSLRWPYRRCLRDLRKGSLFETVLTHRRGKVLEQGEGSVLVQWKDGGRREFVTKGGARAIFPSKRREHIAPMTEVL